MNKGRMVVNPILLEIARLLLEFMLEVENTENHEFQKVKAASLERPKNVRKKRSS